MDLGAIPRTFWHSISFAILVVAVGLTLIAYRSADVSIDFANKTVQLSAAREELNGAIRDAEQLNAELESENQRLEEIAGELRRKVAMLEGRLEAVGTARPEEAEALKGEILEIESDLETSQPAASREEKFKALYDKLDRTRENIQMQVQQMVPAAR